MGNGCCCEENIPEPEQPLPYRIKSPSKGEPDRRKTPFVKRKPEDQWIETISPPKAREDYGIERCMKIGISGNNPLRLIDGYLDEPLVSLEEALQLFHDEIDQLSYNIEQAKANCYYSSQHGLTHDESAAIYIYTMKWSNRCVHDHLHASWSSEDRSKMKPWLTYLRLLKSAYDKLPNGKIEVWQGNSYSERLMNAIDSNSASFYTCMRLALPTYDRLENYAKKHIDGQVMLVGFKEVAAKLLSGYSANQFNGYLLWPGNKLGVAEWTESFDKHNLIIHMKGKHGT